MRNKYNLWYQLKIIFIILISVIFVFSLYATINKETSDSKNKIIKNWTAWQKNMIDNSIEQAINNSIGNIEGFITEKIIPELEFNEASYAVFYKNNTVIFENNIELTKMYGGNTIRNTYGTYSYYGGYHLTEVLEPMENGKSGSDYFVKNHFKGNEYITWETFKYNDDTYILGSVTAEKYILSLYDFEGRKNNLYAYSYIYTFLIILFAILLCFANYRYDKLFKEYTKSNKESSDLIAKQKNIVRDLETRLERLSIYDFLTGLYNRKFFDVFFPKLEADIFIPVSIAIIDVDGLKLINNAFGYEKGDKVLLRIANVCSECFEENDLVSRYGADEFAIIMINTTYQQATEKISEVCNKISEKSIDDISIDLSYGIASKTSEEDNLFDMIELAEKNLQIDKLSSQKSYHSGSVSMLRRILHEKTSETEEHCERIKKFAEKLAAEIGMNEKEKRQLGLLAYLHDVGKIAIPDSVLNKNGPLTEEEYEIMKSHPMIGYNIAMASPDLKVIAKYILQHHEKWDGTGYPKGIDGEKISLEARIIAIVDSFDAMVNRRVYKDGSSVDRALKEIENCAGSHFDPSLAKKFVEIIRRDGLNIGEMEL